MFDSTLDHNQQQTILAVDDNTYTLRIVQHALEQAGFYVLTAVSGKEALQVIERHGNQAQDGDRHPTSYGIPKYVQHDALGLVVVAKKSKDRPTPDRVGK
jgi:CheY-like chemotaxis protein